MGGNLGQLGDNGGHREPSVARNVGDKGDTGTGTEIWGYWGDTGGLLDPRGGDYQVKGLARRGKAWSDDTSQLGPDKHARDVPALDKYAEERWEVSLGVGGWFGGGLGGPRYPRRS